jgi:hypothetical protein
MEPNVGAFGACFYRANSCLGFKDAIDERPWIHDVGVGGDLRATAQLGHVNLVFTDRTHTDAGNGVESVYDMFDRHTAGHNLAAGDRRSAPFQLVNHFPNNQALVNKGSLVRALNRAYSLAAASGSHGGEPPPSRQHVFDTIPVTYLVPGGIRREADSPVLAQFLRRFANVAHGLLDDMRLPPKQCERNLWIVKPAAGGAAASAVVCSTIADIRSYTSHMRGDFVIQKCACAACVCICGSSRGAVGFGECGNTPPRARLAPVI